MSTCISRHGEYSKHEPGDWCPRCGAFNEEAIVAERDQLRVLVRDLCDPDPCWFDHHGGCQAHGYLSLERGQLCPHEEAKQLLSAAGEDKTDD